MGGGTSSSVHESIPVIRSNIWPTEAIPVTLIEIKLQLEYTPFFILGRSKE
jgi:hypothetical protein